MAASVLHRLVVRRADAAVLLVRNGNAWSLPEIVLEERHTAEVEHLNAAVLERWGVVTTALAGLTHDDAADEVRRAHALEAHEQRRHGDALRWASLAEIESLCSTDDV